MARLARRAGSTGLVVLSLPVLPMSVEAEPILSVSPVSDTLVIGNSRKKALNVVAFLTTSDAFTVGAASFGLAPNDTQSVVVTYTLTATAAVSSS